MPSFVASPEKHCGSILYRTHDQIVSISRLIDALKNHAMQLESICHIIVSLVKNHLENYWYTRVN